MIVDNDEIFTSKPQRNYLRGAGPAFLTAVRRCQGPLLYMYKYLNIYLYKKAVSFPPCPSPKWAFLCFLACNAQSMKLKLHDMCLKCSNLIYYNGLSAGLIELVQELLYRLITD